MNNERIGVIVPVYKTEKYIAECIESILAQTYTNFRLILVDDGTPDGAGAICDEYATKDPRITVIHQENAGVTRARARGVEEATDCEWITFVDSDDKIKNIFLEELHLLTVKNDTDIVLCTKYYTETETEKQITDYPFCKELNIIEFRKLMARPDGGMPWGRLFKKENLDNWVFDIPREVYYGEDAIMNLRIAFNTEKNVIIIDNPLYFYRQQTQGVCNNFKLNCEYEELLRQHFYISIPQETFHIYKESYLYRRTALWRSLFNNSLFVPWAKTPFHKTLLYEIQKYNYNIPFTCKLLLRHTNPILRFFIIAFRKVSSIKKRINNLFIARHCKKE